jgi:hypothetical protein
MANDTEVMAVLGEYHDRFIALGQAAAAGKKFQTAILALQAWKKMQAAANGDEARRIAEDFLTSPEIANPQ